MPTPTDVYDPETEESQRLTGSSPEEEPKWYKAAQAEQDGLQGSDETAAGEQSAPEEGKGKRRKAKMSARKKWIITAVTTGVLGGGGAFGATVLQGPASLLHFGQLLGLHFESENNGSDNRLINIIRYVRDPAKPENLRIGSYAAKIAERVDQRFARFGITSAYTDTLGYFDGYVIDKEKLDGPFRAVRGASDAQVADFFRQQYGVAVVYGADGRLVISARGLSYGQTKGLISMMMRSVGYHGLVAQIKYRIMVKRAGAVSMMKPLKKFVTSGARTLDQERTDHNARRIAERLQGAAPEIATSPGGTEAEQQAERETSGVLEGLQEAQEEAQSGTGETQAQQEFSSNFRAKVLGGGLGAAGIASTLCFVQYLSTNYDSTKMDMIVDPLKRFSVEHIALSSQIMAADPDINLVQMGWYREELTDNETGLDAFDARSLQHAAGEPVNGPADPPEVRLDSQGNGLTQALAGIDGLSGFCSIQENPFVSGTLLAVGIVTGPFSTAAQTAGMLVFEHYLPEMIKWFVGNPLKTMPVGPTGGSYGDYGAFYSALDLGAASGGMPLSQLEATELERHNRAIAREEFQSQSLAYRLFNPYDYRSLASRMIDHQEVLPADATLSSVASSFTSVFKLPWQAFSSLASARVIAADIPYDYGVPMVGTPVEEYNSPLVQNPYKNADIAFNQIIKGPQGETYIERAKACNGMNIGLDGTVRSTGVPPTIKQINDPANNCADRSENWLRVRFYMKDTAIIQSLACYEGLAEACNEVDFPTGGLKEPPAEAAMTEPSMFDLFALGLGATR